MQGPRIAIALAMMLLAVTGCSMILDLPGIPPAAVTAQLEVYNRTTLDIVLVAADGEEVQVPACGHEFDPSFSVDLVRVGAAGWYVRGFGMGSDAQGKHVTLVEVARGEESGVPLEEPPATLPDCAGSPAFQEGVPMTE